MAKNTFLYKSITSELWLHLSNHFFVIKISRYEILSDQNETSAAKLFRG